MVKYILGIILLAIVAPLDIMAQTENDTISNSLPKTSAKSNYGIEFNPLYSNQIRTLTETGSSVFINHGESADSVSIRGKIGLGIHFFYETYLTPFLVFKTKLGYLPKGFEVVASNNETSYKYFFEYLTINPLFKIAPFEGKFSPYAFGGVRGELLFYVQGIDSKGNYIDTWGKDDFKSINLGGTFGVGMKLSEKLNVEVEYNPDFNYSYDKNGAQIKNNTWMINLSLNVNKILAFEDVPEENTIEESYQSSQEKEEEEEEESLETEEE